MSICKLNLTRLLMLGILLLFSTGAFALGLGNAKAESYLNQPLNVRIDMLAREGEDLSGVTAKLASAEDYALIGANRDAISVPLRFNVDVQSEQPFIRVTSNLPVNDPVVRLIIELNWASGRLLREYTLFLDPPTVSSAAPPPLIDERTKPAVSAAPVPTSDSPEPQEAFEPEEEYEDTDSTQATSNVAGEFTGDEEYGPVQSGDTLWRIASNWSEGSGASINQVMVAIQTNNPQAFINNNINLLKRGAILRMPSSADIAAISVAEANSQVRAQSEQFAGGAAAPTPTPAEPSSATAVETPLVDVASDMSGAESESPRLDDSPQLEIVPPSEGSVADSAYGEEESTESGSASTSVVDLQEELARKEEALITEQQTNEYLQERIKELESQIAATDDASLTVEDEELAGMESRLREQRINEAEAGEAPAASTQIPQVTTSTGDEAQPWYTHWVTWLIAVLVLVAGGFGWYRSKIANEGIEFDLNPASEDAVKGIKDEAEEILKVLDPKAKAESDDDGLEPAPGPLDEPAEETQADSTDKPAGRSKARHDDSEEASVLDEDSADPEVRLDLARAYISMGDREAARAILGEVIEHGDEAQQAEAKSMLDEM